MAGMRNSASSLLTLPDAVLADSAPSLLTLPDAVLTVVLSHVGMSAVVDVDSGERHTDVLALLQMRLLEFCGLMVDLAAHALRCACSGAHKHARVLRSTF